MNPLLKRTLRAADRGLKAAAISFAGSGGGGLAGSWGSSLYPGSRFNYQQAAGSGYDSSAVMACILWIARAFPEAPLRISTRAADGSEEPQHDHPLPELLKQPNPFYSGALLWMATVAEYTIDGNAYWRKLRNANGGIAQLWYVPGRFITPRWPADGSEFISHYEYNPNGRPETIDLADIVHFRFGVDPNNPRKGLSPLASALRELYSDNQAATFSGALLRNLGVPGVILSPEAPEAIMTKGDSETIKQEFKSKFTGDNAGDVMVIGASTKVSVLAWSPQQMDLRSLRRLPEERISAVLGVPAVVAGLGAGLDRSTYSNMKEAREAAYEHNIIPTQRLFAADIRAQLLPDYGDPAALLVDFDNTKVRALQDDQNALAVRAKTLVEGGIQSVGEGRRMMGLNADESHDFYLRPFLLEAVPIDDPFALERHDPVLTPAPRTTITEVANPNAGAGVDPAGTTVQPRLLPAPKSKAAPLAKSVQSELRTRARLVERLAGRFNRQLSGLFAKLGRDILKRWTDSEGRATPADLVDATWDTRLRDAGAVFAQTASEQAVARVATETGATLTLSSSLALSALRFGQSLTGVNDTTRADLDAVIRAGIAAGYTPEQIASGVEADGYRGISGVVQEMSTSRALTIARTETARFYNESTLLAYGAANVAMVNVTDGDQDEECAAADGSVWTLEEAQGNLLSHPNCVRSFTAVTDSGNGDSIEGSDGA